MLFKLGLKNLKHNFLMNLLIVFQITIILVLTISMVSTIVSRFKYYTPIKEQLNSKGFFYCVDDAMNPQTGLNLRTTDELYELIEGEKEIFASYNVWLTYGENDADFISYDDKFIEIFTPKLESGCWFDLNKSTNDTVQVVVSQNSYGFKIGDRVKFDSFGETLYGEIIGILSEDAKIIGFTASKNEMSDCRSTFMNYNYEIEEKPLFIFNQSELSVRNIVMQLDGPVFVTYDESVSDYIIRENHSIIKMMMTLNITPLNEMKSNSMKYIFSQMFTLFPILICILILTLVGAVSVSALSAKRQLKNYAVYYICGLKWKQCSMVNLYSSLICVVISFVLSITSIIVIKTTNILPTNALKVNKSIKALFFNRALAFYSPLYSNISIYINAFLRYACQCSGTQCSLLPVRRSSQ